MNAVKSSVLKDPSIIVHSITPSSVIAGRIEYLTIRVSMNFGQQVAAGPLTAFP